MVINAVALYVLEEEIVLVSKLWFIFFVLLMIPQGIMFWMAASSPLEGNKHFKDIEALALASALILMLGMSGLTINWLIGKNLVSMGH